MNKNCYFLVLLLLSVHSRGQSMKWPVRSSTGEVRIVDFSGPTATVSATIPGFGNGGQEEINILTDAANNILFITAADGSNNISVFDASMNPMPNGDNIRGSISAYESAICKISCTSDRYYYFNYASSPQDSLYYSIIDMSANGGNGDVIQKNNYIASGFTEGMTLSHQLRNGCRWLLIPGLINDTLTINEIQVSYLGVSPPVVVARIPMSSSISPKHEIELSSDNSKLIVSTHTANPNDSDIIVFDFDLQSGNVTNPRMYGVSSDPVLGIEFSPDGNKIYFQTHTTLTPSTLGRVDLVTDSVQLIDTLRDRNLTEIELSANGRLYTGPNLTTYYLSEIADPNNPFIANVGYTKDKILVDSTGCRPGLPNFIDGEPPGHFLFPTGDDFLTANTSNCLEYQFVDSSCLSNWWHWDFGDGNTSGVSAPIHQYMAVGNYQVTLRVRVCTDTFTVSRNTPIGLINLPVSAPSNAVVCNGTPVSLTANGATSFSWSPGNGLNTTSGSNVIANPSATTVYTVTGSVPLGCTGSAHVTVTPINIVPQIVPSGSVNICSGSSTTLTVSGGSQYNWSNGMNTQAITVSAAGTYSVSVSNSGCQVTDSITVNVLPPMNPVITSYPGSSFCLGDSVQLTLSGNGIISHQWQRNNLFTGQSANSIYVYTSGSYSAIVSDVNGCVDTPSTTITLHLSPAPRFSTDSVCSLSKDFQNFSSNSVQYFWSFGDGATTNATSPQHMFPSEGTYNVKLVSKSPQGCLDSIEKKVPVALYATSAFTTSYDSCTGETRFNPVSTAAQTYTWEFGDNNGSSAPRPVNNYQSAGSYQVSLTTNKNFSCEEQTVHVIKAPEPINDYLYIPNSFSPNGDGINDLFTIYGHSTCGEYELLIYDRWGELVYATNDITKFWDGKRNGQGIQGGVYCWVIKEKGKSRTGMVLVYL